MNELTPEGVTEPPVVMAVATSFRSDTTTRVASVSFDSERLSVLVENAGWEAEVVFEQIFGFRVLDELDLTRFWSHCSLKVGWLFEVTAGGWMALERTRPDFHTGALGWAREFLIVGRDSCVSVMTKEEVSVVPCSLHSRPRKN